MSSLTVTIIQTNLSWENKKANLETLAQKIESIKDKTEVVILPEMFSTGFSMKPEVLAEKMNGETIEWMKKIAAQKQTTENNISAYADLIFRCKPNQCPVVGPGIRSGYDGSSRNPRTEYDY